MDLLNIKCCPWTLLIKHHAMKSFALYFNPEDGSDMLLRNICLLSLKHKKRKKESKNSSI
jgi:hypothetical protein